MALHIIKASDPITVEHVNTCIYAPPGVGKTTLGFTSDSPLCFDFDKGTHRAKNRKDTVPVKCWNDVANISSDDLDGYHTIMVDTAGRCLDFISADIIKENPKLGRGGALTLQGFGVLKTRFTAWLKMLNTFGKDVVLIAHMDEQRNGDEVIERLDVQGGSKGEIYKSVDAMGRIFIRNNQRILDFSPRENSFGKNPCNFDVMTIPDVAQNNHFLADVIRDMKERMNQLSEEQKEAQRIAEEWAEAINGYSTPEEFNQHIAGIKQAPKVVQSLFAASAKKLGFVFNQTSHAYEAAHA